MPNSALVILGAGASYDSVSEPIGSVIDRLKPPLTQDIFTNTELVRDTIEGYTRARAIAPTIAIETASGRPLEEVLAELHGETQGPRVAQFNEIPLYLQDLFGQVSGYATQPSNYTYLADQLLHPTSGFDQVAFVTLNYDLLLDRVLEPDYLPGILSDTNRCITERCLLVKLHGSVNWWNRIVAEIPLRSGPHNNIPMSEYLSLIAQVSDLRQHLDPQIRASPQTRTDQSIYAVGRLYYPALAVPLGQYKFVCPPDHIEALKTMLPTCSHVLALGVSGKDQDLFELLASHLELCKVFTLVGRPDKETREAYDRFLNSVPQLRATERTFFGSGLSEFIVNGYLSDFVPRTRNSS